MDSFADPMDHSPPSPPPPERAIKKAKTENVDSELSSRNLSGRSLTLSNCYVTQVLTFPRSLAVCRQTFSWNATCWLDQFELDNLTLNKISDHCETNYGLRSENPGLPFGLEAGQILDFQGSLRSSEFSSEIPEIRLLVIFPHMKGSIKSMEMQKIWTDQIVLPPIYRHISPPGRQRLPLSYESLRLNSRAPRVEMGLDVGDAPACYRLSSSLLPAIWADIVAKTQQKGFEEFRGAFLVALGYWHPNATLDESPEGPTEGAWKQLTMLWASQMDMEYIPAETFEVRMASEFGLSG
jgi:hypothetical protein